MNKFLRTITQNVMFKDKKISIECDKDNQSSVIKTVIPVPYSFIVLHYSTMILIFGDNVKFNVTIHNTISHYQTLVSFRY